MICPKCGANQPDGAMFCSNCGGDMTSAQQYQPQQYQPQPQQYQVPYQTKEAPVSKGVYLKTMGSETAKRNTKLILLTMLISLALIVGSIVSTLNMPFYEIPLMETVLAMAEVNEDEVDELLDDLDDSLDILEEEIDADLYDGDELEVMEKLLKVMEDLSDNFSIMNVKKLANVVEEAARETDMDMDLEQTLEIQALLSGVMVLVIAAFFLPVLFALLGGLLKNTVLTILAAVFTAITQLMFCGMLWVALSLVVYIFQAVLCSRLSREYKDYRLGKLRA